MRFKIGFVAMAMAGVSFGLSSPANAVLGNVPLVDTTPPLLIDVVKQHKDNPTQHKDNPSKHKKHKCNAKGGSKC